MSTIYDLVRNSPFGGPVAHAKCQGLKVNDQRTVAALAVDAGKGKNDGGGFVLLKDGIVIKITDLKYCSRSSALKNLWLVIESKHRSFPASLRYLNLF